MLQSQAQLSSLCLQLPCTLHQLRALTHSRSNRDIATDNLGINEGKQVSHSFAITTSRYQEQIHGDRGGHYIKKSLYMHLFDAVEMHAKLLLAA